MPTNPAVIAALEQQFPNVAKSEFRGDTRVVIPRESAPAAMRWLKDVQGFDYLVDITCVDYLHYREERPDRFGLVYLLANTANNERLQVRVFLGEENPRIASVVPLWEGANWLEREVYDMFGIVFEGHPDLRRILMPDVSEAFPLRKDYPLQGRGERHNHPVLTRAKT